MKTNRYQIRLLSATFLAMAVICFVSLAQGNELPAVIALAFASYVVYVLAEDEQRFHELIKRANIQIVLTLLAVFGVICCLFWAVDSWDAIQPPPSIRGI